MTAHRCLLADGRIEGKTVLIAGGAGAVGRSAIELARWLGAARILATVSSDEKAEIARAAGADATIDYTADGAIGQARDLAGDGVERIVELAPGPNLELDLAVAAPNAVIASYAHEGREPQLDVRRLMVQNTTMRFVLVYTMPREAIAAAATDITRALEAGALTEPRLHRFPLEGTAAAHDAVEAGPVGKVIIDLPR
jgi:NADPH2:quinone reductase